MLSYTDVSNAIRITRPFMETRSHKRRRLSDDTMSDHLPDQISCLPDEVLRHILSFLPIKSIAQTSVLSKRFLLLWQTFPDLDFTTINETRMIASGRSRRASQCMTSMKTMEVINLVLYQREMLAWRFIHRKEDFNIRVMRFRVCSSFTDLHHLIRRIMKQNVQELDVQVVTDDYSNFSRGVLAIESLKVFKLSCNPGFRLPPSSVMRKAFRLLHTLSFSRIFLDNQPDLRNLFTESSFPLLKKLSLDTCEGLKHIKVCCPALEDFTLENSAQLLGLEVKGWKLEKLRVAGCFDAHAESWFGIDAPNLRVLYWENNAITYCNSIQNLNCLHEAVVGFSESKHNINTAKLMGMVKVLSGLSAAQCLTIRSQCIEVLSVKNYGAAHLSPFNNIKSLELHINFDRHSIVGLASLFKNSPELQTLVLKITNEYTSMINWNDLWHVSSTVEEQYWESQAHSLKDFLKYLNEVRIQGFRIGSSEISLVKFLLKHGIALKHMTLGSWFHHELFESQMKGFSQAHSKAEIKFIRI